ncbi:General transcription factor 3C polypeptide 5 [Dermatophagoides pteronyssinus]|uniref:General transcription factor 3C polypeptide 5 n=1 Tax=Dermatophagoides pteronyssinus TaxID=6956 RepID=A0ABQ8J3A4_DERPT|nr:General transcription factor 3C polypeptide 5 [Dermatophagoides pteronyssinus]
MDSNNKNLQQMFVIDSPAKVINLQNFYKCCGGLNQIGQTFKNERERLRFRFRPDDPNSIPLFSDRKQSRDLVLKVRRKRQPDGTFSDYQFEPFGIINTTFHFENSICDMQLLPTSSDIRNEFMKSDFILNCDPNSSIKNDQSITMMKQYFYSRFFQPKQLIAMMRKDVEKNDQQQDLIRRLRKSRKVNFTVVRWDDESVPVSLPEEYRKDFDKNLLRSELARKIKEKFDERFCWSRYGLICHLKCSPLLLRYILPYTTYYFENGPFRALWIPYGYDPRKDPKAKIYQTIEARANRKSDQTIHAINQIPLNQKGTIFKDNTNSFLDKFGTKSISNNENDDNDSIDPSYLFRPGQLSTLKRTTFQLCDIEIDQVQQIIHENDGQEFECTEKDGWLTKGSVDRIRAIMNHELSLILNDTNLLQEHSQTLDTQDILPENIEITEVYDDNLEIYH